MNIQPLSVGMENELSEFLNSLANKTQAPSVLGYHYPAYLNMLRQILGSGTSDCSFVAKCPRSGAIRGFLPGLIHQSGGRSCYNSLPFFGPNVGVLSNAENTEDESSISVSLVETAIAAARNQKAITAVFYTRFDPLNHANTVSPAAWLATRYTDLITIPKTTHFLPLVEAPSIPFPSTIRYDIRKAAEAGVQICNGCAVEQLPELYEIYVQNCVDHGIPRKPFDCVQRLHEISLKESTVQFYTAKKNEELAGGLVTLWGPVTVSYYLPCSKANLRSFQPGTLAIAYAMQHATKHGRRIWNWESTSENSSGVAHFKRKWGSSTSNYQILIVPMIEKNNFNELMADELARDFPYYFVYPYSLLPGTVR